VKPLHITLVAAAVAAAVGVFTFLLVGNDDKPSASQPTSTALPSSSPGAGWTEEEMRNARPRDTTVGPRLEALVIGGAVLAGGTTAAVLLVNRRRSSSR
jgi:hypothetical protein